jgi:hypothetical protein
VITEICVTPLQLLIEYSNHSKVMLEWEATMKAEITAENTGRTDDVELGGVVMVPVERGANTDLVLVIGGGVNSSDDSVRGMPATTSLLEK